MIPRSLDEAQSLVVAEGFVHILGLPDGGSELQRADHAFAIAQPIDENAQGARPEVWPARGKTAQGTCPLRSQA
jgi:hypothetical protein